MLYLSELLGKSVVTKNETTIGTLTDLVFVVGDVPYITKLQVKTGKHTTTFFPVSSLRRINGHIQLENPQETTLGENEFCIKPTLLNRQIIDIKGKNIVRVNDVVIQDRPTMTVSGIDIGLLGILRWFSLEDALLNLLQALKIKATNHLLPWTDIQPLELASGQVVLNQEKAKLQAIPPEDLADYLEKTTIQNAMKILSVINDETASEVLQNLNINFQTQLFRQMPLSEAISIINFADPDEAVDLLLTISEEKRSEMLEQLSEKKRNELTFLLDHSETAIGELMTTEFITFTPEETAKSALDRIKKETADYTFVPYGYVLNNKQELSGVFSLHELLLQTDNTPLVKFMIPNVVVIHLTTPQIITMKRMLKYKLRALPVIDAHKRTMLGIVTFDDIVEPYVGKLEA